MKKGREIPFREIRMLEDGTKMYVESTFPENHSFTGIKEGNRINMSDGNWWVLSSDFKECCKAYEYIDVIGNQKKLEEFIDKIGVETFALYLNMIFNDDSDNSMRGQYEEELERTGDMNLAIISCIEEDFTYA